MLSLEGFLVRPYVGRQTYPGLKRRFRDRAARTMKLRTRYLRREMELPDCAVLRDRFIISLTVVNARFVQWADHRPAQAFRKFI